MNEKYYNLYITSINKNGNDTSYNYNLYLSNYGIRIQQDEIAFINITGFQTLNSFYNINDNSKKFTVKIRTDQDMTFTYSFESDTGNYDIYNFMSSVNTLCSAFFTMSYNEKKNKWNYTSNQSINTTVYLIPNIYNAKYFGLNSNINNEILPAINSIGTYSKIINMNNFSLIIIKILGLVEPIKAIDNFSASINKGDISCIVNRQDSNVGSLISYTDTNENYIKQISNIEINQLTFIFSNEFNQLLIDIDEWLLILKITIKKKN